MPIRWEPVYSRVMKAWGIKQSDEILGFTSLGKEDGTPVTEAEAARTAEILNRIEVLGEKLRRLGVRGRGESLPKAFDEIEAVIDGYLRVFPEVA